ncbi:MAG: GTPase HflX [Clostridiales bacterium]|nr:GTPase HflX [Clostridiales bacterium]
MKEKINRGDTMKNRAILAGMNDTREITNISIDESMKELEELAKASGVEVVATTIQNRETVRAATYLGKGKIEEIKNICESMEIDLVIFNDELSGSQIRNLEDILEVDVLDRTSIILDIFAKRAKTNEAKLQVELAQLKYLLPRLVGMGKKLSRLGAGIGTRGPGETKLESDRRHILRKIDLIRERLKDIKRVRSVQRSKREKTEIPIVALVGYTNSGKSTIMNTLLKMSEECDLEKQVFAKDMPFATLEISLRRISLDDNFSFILIDTVGFVSKLPHYLVEAFKATLEEVKYADLLIHVIDASNENYIMQKETTNKVLAELGAECKNIIHVFNKIDIVEDICDIPRDEQSINISAQEGTNIELLIEKIREEIEGDVAEVNLLIPHNKGYLISQLHKSASIKETIYRGEGVLLRTKLNKIDYTKYKEYEA